MKNEDKSDLKEFMDSKLVKKLRLYTLIMVLMILIVSIEVIKTNFNLEFAIIGFILGIIVGIIITRIYKLSWDSSTNNVIGTVDVVGVIILIIYLIFVFTRTYYIGQWVQGTPLFAFVISITAGTMFGRIINTRRDVFKILRALQIR